MSIIKNPKKSLRAFLLGAETSFGGTAKGHRRQITITVPKGTLIWVDAFAKRTGQTRSAVINRAIFEFMEIHKTQE